MAKKTTRQRKELAQQRAVQQAVANVSQVTARTAAPAANPSPTPSARVTTSHSDDYPYIRDELRRIAVLAAGIVTILIVLSFIIR